jgi:MFS family permease
MRMRTPFHPEEFTQDIRQAEPPAMLKRASDVNAQDASTEPGAAKPAAGEMLHPFTVRNFNLLFGGQTISVLGDALYAVALPWLILNNGGSAQALGIVLAAYGIPRVGSMLLGGWLSDRLRPRRLMLLADLVRAGLVGGLSALALWGHPTVLQLCAVAVPLGACGGAFLPASMSILPDILSDDDLQAGNALNLASMQAALLVGSALAGVVVAAFTAGAGLAIDAATFLVSAVSLALMRAANSATSRTREAGESRENPQASTQEQGAQVSFWRYLHTSRLIQVILLIAGASGFCFGGLLEVALPTLIHGPMHGDASGYGAILAAWGAGALGGGIFAGTLGKRKHKGLLMLGDGLILAASIALLPTGGIAFAMVCMLIGGVANSITNVLLFTVVQLVIPRHLLGRVMGLLMFGSLGTYPISVAVVGTLSNQFGPAILFPGSSLLLALVMLFGMTQRVAREL